MHPTLAFLQLRYTVARLLHENPTEDISKSRESLGVSRQYFDRVAGPLCNPLSGARIEMRGKLRLFDQRVKLAMKLMKIDPPREYECGFDVKRTIRDCARVDLNADEQITFLGDSGAEYDVTRKDFGFYATPSTNGRLARFGLRTAIARNRLGQLFVLLVESGKEPLFERYLSEEKMQLMTWLDTDERADALMRSLNA
jgi:hypothetical protein